MNDPLIELVIFDLASISGRDEHFVSQSLIKVLSEFGYVISPKEANVMVGISPYTIEKQLKKKASPDNIFTGELINKIYAYFIEEVSNSYRAGSDNYVINSTCEILRKLKNNGIKVGIDTMFSKEVADIILDNLQWKKEGLVDACVSGDEVKDGRPYPYMINRLMRLLNIKSPDRVAKVGNTITDLQAGNHAACKYVVGITSGNATVLETAPHTHLIRNLSEIENIITREIAIEV